MAKKESGFSSHYTLGIMLFVVVVTHGLIYLLAPRMQLDLSTRDSVVISIRREQFVTEAVEKALPISLSCSLVISVICSLLFSKAIADPIKRISETTERMMKLDRAMSCPIQTKDEIGAYQGHLCRKASLSFVMAGGY